MNLNTIDKVCENFRAEIAETDNKDTINKAYRQLRIWTRCQWRYAEEFTHEDAEMVNYRLKTIRWNRLRELGFNTPISDSWELKNDRKH